MAVTRLGAPAKLTLSLRVLGRRADGYHDLAAEMVSVDLADSLEIDPKGDGFVVEVEGIPAVSVDTGPENLVRRALVAVGRRAGVRLVKRIPIGGGLGGGSTDAAAVLRWAGCTDARVAASLGADVPFCLAGGRAEVAGIGERVSSLPFEQREFVLLVPPFGMHTGAVYAAWDSLGSAGHGPNDLVGAALAVRPDLARWRDCLAEATGRLPLLAGSGSTWFVEGSRDDLGVSGLARLGPERDEGRLLDVRTVPAGWEGPDGGPGTEVG
jgi:4-diphosphocytidyl-2-C-methyl-D-erythritol kinase